MRQLPDADFVTLREALEASWRPDTAFLQVYKKGNPALGQCYPTARVVQHFFPEFEIVEGEVWTGEQLEKHFWNIHELNNMSYLVDFTWQQFPQGSIVKNFKIRDRNTLGDRPETIKRVELLLERVNSYLESKLNISQSATP
jgi:hypothetical protein